MATVKSAIESIHPYCTPLDKVDGSIDDPNRSELRFRIDPGFEIYVLPYRGRLRARPAGSIISFESLGTGGYLIVITFQDGSHSLRMGLAEIQTIRFKGFLRPKRYLTSDVAD